MPKKKKRYHARERKNLELRAWIIANGVQYKDIAKRIFISQSTLSQWLQNDMHKWQVEEVIQAVKEIVIERGNRDEEVRRKESDSYDRLRSRMALYMDSVLDEHIGEQL